MFNSVDVKMQLRIRCFPWLNNLFGMNLKRCSIMFFVMNFMCKINKQDLAVVNVMPKLGDHKCGQGC